MIHERNEVENIAASFSNIFSGRNDARGTLQGGCVKEPLSISHYIRHLGGKESLGLYPLLEDGTCKCAVVDFDFKSKENNEMLAEKSARAFAKKLFQLGLKSYWFERSKSGLIHLWMFFSEPVEARRIRKVLRYVAGGLNLKIINGEVEIFPKQDELKSGQVGNYIHLPYFGALNEEQLARRVMLDPRNLEPLSLEHFVNKVQGSLISPLELDEVFDSINEEETHLEGNGHKTDWDKKKEQIIKLINPSWIEGQRQDLSMYLAGFLAKQGISWEDTQALILEVAVVCNDKEIGQRLASIKSTYDKANGGDEVKGYSGLKHILDSNDLITLADLFSPKRVSVESPAPLKEPALHGLAGEIVRTIEPHSEADSVALLMNFLTAFGNVIGDRAHFNVGADKHRMRLFTVLVGETSKARKGTSWGYIEHFFKDIDPDWSSNVQTGLSSGEGLIWAVRDEVRKKKSYRKDGVINYDEIIDDEGVADKRLLVLESEFASTLKIMSREGNILSPVIRNAWDKGDLQTLTKNSPAKATGSHISIIGHIGKEELLKYLTNTEAGNGFGNRFLWFYVKRSRVLPFGGEFHQMNTDTLFKKLEEAVEFARTVDKIVWADETKPLWEAVYPKLSAGKPGLVGALTARAEAYVTRLACVYALLDKSTVIKPEHLNAALAIWEYAENSVKYIFQNATGNQLANKIRGELKKKHPNGLIRTEISDHFNRNYTSEAINHALITLENLGVAEMDILATGGRPKELWKLK